MLALSTNTPQDPALSARTFSQNPTLARALERIRAQNLTVIPYTRSCAVCRKPIFSADTTAIPDEGENGQTVWTHPDCHPESVNTGAEVDGSDAQDNQPGDRELQEHFLTIKGWQRVDVKNPPATYFIDPADGLAYFFIDALDIQNAREDAQNQ